MGNVLFRCGTTSTKSLRGNRGRRSLWVNLLSTCGLEGCPSMRSRRSVTEKGSSSYQEPCSEWFSENMCIPRWHDSAKPRRPVKYASRSRFTSKASISLPQENSSENLLPSTKEEWHVNSPASQSSQISTSSPDTARKFSNKDCYLRLHVHSPTSGSSPIRSGSPDIMWMTSNQHCYEQLHVNSPSSGSPSISHGSRELTRMSDFNQHCYQQRHVDSSTSRSVSGTSPDTTRNSFNQHCYQQRHPVSPKKSCQSPRRHVKQGSGKSSRRKRIGMRSPSHRTSNSKSPGRILKDSEDKSYEMRFQSHRTSNFKTLRRALEESLVDSEDNSNRMRSQSHKTSQSKSPGRTVQSRIQDNEHNGAQYRSFSGSQVAVASPITRKAALSLIGRQKGFGNWRNGMHSSEHCRRHWRPALESISESADWELF